MTAKVLNRAELIGILKLLSPEWERLGPDMTTNESLKLIRMELSGGVGGATSSQGDGGATSSLKEYVKNKMAINETKKMIEKKKAEIMKERKVIAKKKATLKLEEEMLEKKKAEVEVEEGMMAMKTSELNEE
jgi:hypothetical protein